MHLRIEVKEKGEREKERCKFFPFFLVVSLSVLWGTASTTEKAEPEEDVEISNCSSDLGEAEENDILTFSLWQKVQAELPAPV